MHRYQKVVYIVNGLLLAWVIIFIAVSSWFLSDYYFSLIPLSASHPSFIYAYYALLAQAGFVQALGCYAAFKLNKNLLYVFWFWMFSLLLGDIAVGMYWVFRFGTLMTSLSDNLKSSIENDYGVIETVTQSWDNIQRMDKCCGSHGPMDYLSSNWYQMSVSRALSLNVLPSSCCKLHSTTNEVLNSLCTQSYDNAFIYKIGCDGLVSAWLKSSATVMFVLGYCMIAFFKAMSLAVLWREINTLARKLHKRWMYAQSRDTSDNKGCIEEARDEESDCETNTDSSNQQHDQKQSFQCHNKMACLVNGNVRRTVSLIDMSTPDAKTSRRLPSTTPKDYTYAQTIHTYSEDLLTSHEEKLPPRHRMLEYDNRAYVHTSRESIPKMRQHRDVRARRSLNYYNGRRFTQRDIDLLKDLMHKKIAKKLTDGKEPYDTEAIINRKEQLSNVNANQTKQKINENLGCTTAANVEVKNSAELSERSNSCVNNGKYCLSSNRQINTGKSLTVTALYPAAVEQNKTDNDCKDQCSNNICTNYCKSRRITEITMPTEENEISSDPSLSDNRCLAQEESIIRPTNSAVSEIMPCSELRHTSAKDANISISKEKKYDESLLKEHACVPMNQTLQVSQDKETKALINLNTANSFADTKPSEVNILVTRFECEHGGDDDDETEDNNINLKLSQATVDVVQTGIVKTKRRKNKSKVKDCSNKEKLVSLHPASSVFTIS